MKEKPGAAPGERLGCRSTAMQVALFTSSGAGVLGRPGGSCPPQGAPLARLEGRLQGHPFPIQELPFPPYESAGMVEVWTQALTRLLVLVSDSGACVTGCVPGGRARDAGRAPAAPPLLPSTQS